MDGITTVVCVDNNDAHQYHNIEYFIKMTDVIKSADKLLIWGTPIGSVATDRSHPQEFINKIKNYDFKYNLIITVTGYIDNEDIQICDEIIKQSNILDNIVDFKIYYCGNELSTTMRFDSLFTTKKFKKQIFKKCHLLYCIDINIDFDKLTLSDLSLNFKYNIISLINKFPEDKTVLRKKFDELFNRLSSQYKKEGSLRLFFENNDVEGCMRFIERGSNNFNEKLLQQKIKELLDLFDNPEFDYVLSDGIIKLPKPVEQFNVLDEDSETDENSITCDITFNKCKQVCLLVRKTDEKIVTGEIYNQIYDTPFLLLRHTHVVKKIVNLIEYHRIDAGSYDKLRNKSVSPFTRQPITGIYIFNVYSENAEPDMVMANNTKLLSEICWIGTRISRCPGLWQLLFLYMLMKFHPKWKNEPEIVKKEIKYICDRTIVPVSLFYDLEPNMEDQLGIALWYVVNVSHKLYPNSPNNVLRRMGEGSTYILDLYSDIFHPVDEELYNKTKLWTVWSYMVRNKRNKRKLLNEILAQYQKYREIEGFLIFFSGQCEKRFESILNILPVEKVLGLYYILQEDSGVFDKIDHVRDHNPHVNFINTSEPSCREHVEISLNTCQAVIVCSNTGKRRTKCALDYTGYLDTFHDFCVVSGKYPKNEYDLITYHSRKHYRTSSAIVVYPVDGLGHFRLVMEKFEKVMKTYAVEDYLKISTDCESVRDGNNIFGPLYLEHCFNERPYCVSSINHKA